jgi:hypothetical protein
MSDTPLFRLGRLVATPSALAALQEAQQSPADLLQRHASGDWGEVDAEDTQANEDALRHGERLLSAYLLQSGVRVWVITEADRSSTCVLLPEEY